MSVIVKDMEMPESCDRCLTLRLSFCKTFKCYEKFPLQDGIQRLPDCPLRPLPKRHGRLIEADSLKETLDYYIREAGWDEKTNRVLGWVKDEFIDGEQTVVESEGDG